MCGIFGAIGRNFDAGIFRALTIANRDRGNESFGCFGSKGRTWKKAGDVHNSLAHDGFTKFLQSLQKTSWFICGHTRYSTRGSGKVTENAHPFTYGPYTGVHNGVIHNAPMTFTVDSQYIWDQLDKAKGDYQKAWEDMRGNWGLAWTDNKFVYLHTHNQSLSIGVSDNGIVYFSSDVDHLKAATGITDTVKFTEGQILKFLPNGTIEELTTLKLKEPTYHVNQNAWRGGHSHSSGYTGGYSGHNTYKERLIGHWNAESKQVEYIPKDEYHQTRVKEEDKINVADDLKDIDLADFSDEWESYIEWEEPTSSDTILEIESSAGMIVVEDKNDTEAQTVVADQSA